METERRHSQKREAIRRALSQAKDHPSAEMIYSRLKGDYPDLSLGTVYRNLSLFREEGGAVCVATVGGQDRFDGCTTPHAHFVCEKCGRVLDVEAEMPCEELFRAAIPGIIHGYFLTFFGVCDQCM